MRILHAPYHVGGQSWAISRAERELGLTSDVVIYGEPVRGMEADEFISIEGTPREIRSRKLRLVRRAIRDYDVIHLNFGRPMLEWPVRGHTFTELGLLKRFGKTVIVTFQGCDARPYSACFCEDQWCQDQTQWRAENRERMLRYADRIFYVNPDLRRWLPRGSFLPYGALDLRTVEPRPPADRDEVVVAHAPTHRRVKGTAEVIASVEKLRGEGLPVRLELIEGVTRDEVLARCAEADVIVDQLKLGWYGGFSVEAMALAKPVLSRISEEEPEDNPFGDELPIVRTSTETITEDLRALVGNAGHRRELGLAGRRFVERHHDPLQVARTVLDGLVDLPAADPVPVPA